MKELPSFDATGLALWQRCPRRFWFERVRRDVADHALTAFAAPLGVAGHAGIAFVLREPGAPRDEVLARMLAAFDQELRDGQARGRSYDPETVERALERLGSEYLDLVQRLTTDPRIRKIEWPELDTRFEWLDRRGRRFTSRVNAIGRVVEPIPGFGRNGWDAVDVAAGTWIVVDWRFGQRLDLSATALGLNLQMAVWLSGLEWRAARSFRAFVGAVRDLAPRRVIREEDGTLIQRTLEELNPDYVRAVAEGRPIGPAVLAEAEFSRRRFVSDGQVIPKRIRRANPDWLARSQEPRGPLFHEAEIAWSVMGHTIERTIEEIEAADRSGREEAYPARGPETQACFSCPFRGQCLPGRARSDRAGTSAEEEEAYEPVGV